MSYHLSLKIKAQKCVEKVVKCENEGPQKNALG